MNDDGDDNKVDLYAVPKSWKSCGIVASVEHVCFH